MHAYAFLNYYYTRVCAPSGSILALVQIRSLCSSWYYYWIIYFRNLKNFIKVTFAFFFVLSFLSLLFGCSYPYYYPCCVILFYCIFSHCSSLGISWCFNSFGLGFLGVLCLRVWFCFMLVIVHFETVLRHCFVLKLSWTLD